MPKQGKDIKHLGMDEVYKLMLPEDIPWNNAMPPQPLIDLIETGTVLPCKTLDLGCGAGNNAIYFASKGFIVTGVDISSTAIGIAEENAKKRKVKCNFIVADVIGDFKKIQGNFDFAFDWELLHHIFPKQREKYVKNVHSILKPKGRYLSLCFSIEDPNFGGKGKYRETKIGTTLYFSSKKELKKLFKPYFHINKLETIQIRGKHTPHIAVYSFMEKR